MTKSNIPNENRGNTTNQNDTRNQGKNPQSNQLNIPKGNSGDANDMRNQGNQDNQVIKSNPNDTRGVNENRGMKNQPFKEKESAFEKGSSYDSKVDNRSNQEMNSSELGQSKGSSYDTSDKGSAYNDNRAHILNQDESSYPTPREDKDLDREAKDREAKDREANTDSCGCPSKTDKPKE